MNATLKIIISMLLYGTIPYFVTLANMPSAHTAFFRTLFGSAFLMLFIILTKHKINFNALKKNCVKLAVSGAFMGLNWVSLFESYRYISTSVSTIIYYLAPVMVLVLAPFLLKEKLSVSKIVGVCIALVGVILLNQNSSPSSVVTIGLILAFISAILYASIILINKKVKGVDGLDSTLVQLLVACIVLFVYMTVTSQLNISFASTTSFITIVILGIVHTGIAYCLYFSAISYVNAQMIALYSYIDPLVVILVSTIFLDESMSFIQVVGAILIFMGAIFGQFYKSKVQKV